MQTLDRSQTPSPMRRFFSFPNPVNETSARLVASGVVVMALGFVFTGSLWFLLPLTYGFVARVACGPRFSPLGRLVTDVVTPRTSFEHKFTAGPPKRFAQAIGAAFSLTALILVIADATPAARVVIALLAGAATLESVFGFCLGCVAFGWLMRKGIVPDEVCADCADIWRRIPEPA